MEISGFTNLGDLVKYMEDPVASDPLKEMKASLNYEGFSHNNLEQASAHNENRPLKQLRASNIPTTFHFLTPIFINPNNTQSKPSSSSPHQVLHSKLAAAHDHSLAERKRREKLSQRFVALSALLPGLKKMDKGSILEDAIKHMKRLEERVRMLEERAKRRSSMIFTVKKEGGDGDGDDLKKSSFQELEKHYLPLIRARFSEREVLISINCERRKGVLKKIVGEIERLNFTLVNSSLLSYGDSSLTITLIIEKRDEEGMSMEQLVRNIQGVLKLL